jgi:hypothetical protein
VLLAFVLAVSAQNIPTPEVRWFTQTVSQRRTRSEVSFFTDQRILTLTSADAV